MMMIARRLRGLRFAADIGLTAVLQAGVALLSYVLNLVIINSLPKEEFGYYSIVIATVIVLGSLTDFGLAAAAAPRIAVARGADTPALKAAMILRFAAVVVVWFGANLYLLATNATTAALVNIGFVAILFSSKFSGLRQFPEYLWRLKGRTYLVTMLALMDMVLQLGAVLILANAGALTTRSIMIAMAAGSIPGFFLILVPLRHMLRESHSFRRKIPTSYYRRLLIASVPMAIFSLFAQISGQLEMFVVDYFGSYADVASVSVPIRAVQGVQIFATTIAFGVAPIVTQIFRKTRSDVSLERLTSIAVRLELLLGFGVCVVGMVGSDLIMSLFGPEYAGEGALLRIYCVISAMTFLVVLLDQILVAIGYRSQVLNGVLFQFACSVVLEVLFIRWGGLRGVLYAKLIATVALIGWQLRVSVPDIRRAALDAIRRWMIPIAALGVSLYLTESLPAPLQGLIVMASAGAAVAFSGAFPLNDLKILREMRVT